MLKDNKRTIILGVLAVIVLVTLLFGGELVGFGIQEYKYYSRYRGSDTIIGDVKKSFDSESNDKDSANKIGDYTITTKYGIVYKFHTEDLRTNFEGQSKTILLSYDGSNLPIGRLVKQNTQNQSNDKDLEQGEKDATK